MRENVGGGKGMAYIGAWTRGIMVSASFLDTTADRPRHREWCTSAAILPSRTRVNDQEKGTVVDAIEDRPSTLPT